MEITARLCFSVSVLLCVAVLQELSEGGVEGAQGQEVLGGGETLESTGCSMDSYLLLVSAGSVCTQVGARRPLKECVRTKSPKFFSVGLTFLQLQIKTGPQSGS